MSTYLPRSLFEGDRHFKIELTKLCRLANSFPDSVVVVDSRSRVAFWNEASKECFGYEPDEIVGRPVSDLFVDVEGARAEFRERFAELGTTKRPNFTIEVRLRRKDGREFPAAVAVAAVKVDGEWWGIDTVRDITSWTLAQESLRKSEARYRSLIENTPDMVMVFDWEGRILYANRSTDAVSAETLPGTKALTHVVPRQREEANKVFRKARRTGTVQQIEIESIHGHHWLCRFVPMTALGGERTIMVICSNVTDHRKAQKVIDSGHDRLRRMLEMQERERKLVAYEIHDGVAQPLTAALMSLESLFQGIEKLRPKEIDLLRSIREMLQDAMADARRVMRGLRPSVLDEFGLKTALENLVQEIEARSGMAVDSSWNIETKDLAGPLETTVYRIVQEGLTNAMLHSKSDRARLDVFEQKGYLHILIEDRGVGFDVDAVEETRFGLEGIRHRARVFGGRAVIRSNPGEGTRLKITLPLLNR